MKTRPDDLAIFGGTPAFADKLHVGRPNVGDRARLLERISEMLDRNWLTNNGPFVQDLERQIAKIAGVKHCVAVCNATIALEIVIRALGLGGEVIVPSFTFIATAHALQWLGITPVFCDIDPRTHNIDPGRIEELLTSQTSGIIGVHLWGRACNVEALSEIVERRKLKLIFDAAHAFGCAHRGTMIGNFGDAEVFSFHATKFLNSFEGGAVVTNDDELAAKMRLMKNFGFADYDQVVYLGTNGKMSEVAAAMALTSLESIDEFIGINYNNYKQYMEELDGLPGISLMTYDEKEKANYQYIVLEIDEEVTQVRRDQLMDILWAENVLARRYFYPGCHRMEPYRSSSPRAGLILQATEKIANRVLVLPTGRAVGPEEITQICSVIKTVIINRKLIEGRLSGRAKATS